MKTRIKNWEKFQHFKDRTPPWIKLHKEVLDQRDINRLSDKAFRVLVGLWLLASEDHELRGHIPNEDDIAFRLRMDKSNVSRCLQELENFLIRDDISVISRRYHDDINMISPRYHHDDPEERREEAEIETEKETEGEKNVCSEPPKTDSSKPDDADTVMEFSVTGRPDKWFLKQSKLSEWESLYGNQLDVVHEIRKARQWMIDNPHKRKTARGMTSFLNSWLHRAINRGLTKGTVSAAIGSKDWDDAMKAKGHFVGDSSRFDV